MLVTSTTSAALLLCMLYTRAEWTRPGHRTRLTDWAVAMAVDEDGDEDKDKDENKFSI